MKSKFTFLPKHLELVKNLMDKYSLFATSKIKVTESQKIVNAEIQHHETWRLLAFTNECGLMDIALHIKE